MKIQLAVADALEKLPDLADESFDLIVADPPYNLGKDYGNSQDYKQFDDYIVFSRTWLKQACRILKPAGTLYVFMGVRFISYLYDLMERECGLNFNSWICWHYTQGLGKTRGFSPRHDDILMFTRTTRHKFNLDAVRVPQKYYRSRNNMRGANPGDVWQFSHVHYCNENRQPHPTQKPEGLIERMVLASSEEGDWVLDPFAGSGTTLRVCQQLQRNVMGIELNPEYVSNIHSRLEQPFMGFDSVDERMLRVPNDLRELHHRRDYLLNHAEWFLKHHPDSMRLFYKEVANKYGEIESNWLKSKMNQVTIAASTTPSMLENEASASEPDSEAPLLEWLDRLNSPIP